MIAGQERVGSRRRGRAQRVGRGPSAVNDPGGAGRPATSARKARRRSWCGRHARAHGIEDAARCCARWPARFSEGARDEQRATSPCGGGHARFGARAAVDAGRRPGRRDVSTATKIDSKRGAVVTIRHLPLIGERSGRREASTRLACIPKGRALTAGLPAPAMAASASDMDASVSGSGSATGPGEVAGVNSKEIHTYEAPWMIYGLAASMREGPDYSFRYAVGSFMEEYSNKVSVSLSDRPRALFRRRGRRLGRLIGPLRRGAARRACLRGAVRACSCRLRPADRAARRVDGRVRGEGQV